MRKMGITKLWVPPCVKSHPQHPQGYYPKDYLDFNSNYGSEHDLNELLRFSKEYSIDCIYDLVCWSQFNGHKREPYKFGKREIESSDPLFIPAIIEYIKLLENMGFAGIRLDYLKAHTCNAIGYEISKKDTNMWLMGELWDSMNYDDTWLHPDQTQHRQQLKNYIDYTDGKINMIDFTTKGILQTAIKNREYWRLNTVPGLIGIDQEHSVTFLDNHDTNWSDQNHWSFAGNCKDMYMIGYIYIMTHPGTPCIYWNHYVDWYKELLELSNIRFMINPKKVEVLEASEKRYTARINDTWLVNIGESISPNGIVAFQWASGIIASISS